MIPAFLTKKPIVRIITVEGEVFRVAGSSDLEQRVIHVNVTAENPSKQVTEADKSKINEKLTTDWQGYTVHITYTRPPIYFPDG